MYVNGTAYSVPDVGETGWGDSLSSALQALAAETSAILTFGATSGAGGATVYAVPGNGAAGATEVKLRVPCAGYLTAIRLRSTSSPTTNSVVATVRKNGADAGLTATMTTAQTSASATGTIGLAAGDDVSVKLAQSSGAGCDNLVISIAFSGG